MATGAAARARMVAIFCELQPQSQQKTSSVVPGLKTRRESFSSSMLPSSAHSSSSSTLTIQKNNNNNAKIVLQPRVCTLRSYGSDQPGGLIRTLRRGGDGGDQVSNFFISLSDYIDNSRRSQDFEIISGRLAMVVFAATLTMEIITGDSLFQKMDFQRIVQVTGVCLGAIVSAAAFAWFSSARTKVGQVFTVKCNTFIDSLIDNLIEGLFFESEFSDWTDEI